MEKKDRDEERRLRAQKEQEYRDQLKGELGSKVAAIGLKARQLFGALWVHHSKDIQVQLTEVMVDAARMGKNPKYALRTKVEIDVEKNRVVVSLGWAGPKRKRGAAFALDEVEPLLPGIEEDAFGDLAEWELVRAQEA